MKDDQWFEPGEKVMRVCLVSDFLPERAHPSGMHPAVDFGKVLCVDRCREIAGDVNRVTFVGVSPRNIDEQIGWAAFCFRRVSEIQLCVRAAEKFKKPVEVENGSLNTQSEG